MTPGTSARPGGGKAVGAPGQPERPERKVAYVAVDHLAAELARRERPELAGRTLIVGGLPHERKHVVDASVEAVRAGVRRGMPLRQAHQLCPEAVFLELDEEGCRRAREGLLTLLEEFSPAVEPLGEGAEVGAASVARVPAQTAGCFAAYLDAAGLTALFGEDPVFAGRVVAAVRERLGLTARLGLGPGKLVARLAARLAREGLRWSRGSSVVVVPAAEAPRFLARQPAWLLPLGPEAPERLARLGIRSIGQFARLPAADLALHFGPAGAAAHRLANGADDAPVVARPAPPVWRAARELEPPIADRERFQQVVGRLLAGLLGELAPAGRGCRTLTLRLELAGGERLERAAQLREATADAGELLRAAERLAAEVEEEDGGQGGIGRVEVELSGVGPLLARQLGLFDGALGEGSQAGHRVYSSRERQARLERAVGRIRRRFGDRVKRLVVAEEDAWLPERRYAVREY